MSSLSRFCTVRKLFFSPIPLYSFSLQFFSALSLSKVQFLSDDTESSLQCTDKVAMERSPSLQASEKNWKICHVCESPPSAPSKEHCYHYGGITCVSCKAFFKYCFDKQLVSEDGQIKYKCVKNKPGSCTISHHLKSKDICKECRYLKCLAAGMDSSLILKGNDKKKYDHSHKKASRKRAATDMLQVKNFIIKAYCTSFNEVFVDDQTMNFLFHGHCREVRWTEQHSEAFIKVLDDHIECLTNMVSRLYVFPEAASHADYQKLKERNACLLKYYIMAQYFTAPDSQSQISWILGVKADNFIKENKNLELTLVSSFEVNQWNHLFTIDNRYKLTLFSNCIEAIHQHFSCQPLWTPLVGYNLVLSTSHWPISHQSDFSDSALIKTLQKQALELLQDDQMGGKFDFLVHLLTTMSFIGPKDFSSQYEGLTQLCTKDGYTIFESKWVDNAI